MTKRKPTIEHETVELRGDDAYYWLDCTWDEQRDYIKVITDEETAYPIQITIVSEPDKMIVEVEYVTLGW